MPFAPSKCHCEQGQDPIKITMAPLSKLSGGLLMLSSAAAAAKYEEYILAPRSRTLYPVKVHEFNGTISGTDSLTGSSGGEAVFDGVSAVTYDFVSTLSSESSFEYC